MPKLRVIWVGKTKRGYAQEGVDHFRKRIKPLAELEIAEIRAASHSGREQGAALKAESDAILKQLGSRGKNIFLLDERGRQPSSRELAEMLEAAAMNDGQGVTFVLGGAYGVDGRVKSAVSGTISLSRLTFPHQLARVVLLEQLYRVLTLAAGHNYHHD